jgi:hypothetical protein
VRLVTGALLATALMGSLGPTSARAADRCGTVEGYQPNGGVVASRELAVRVAGLYLAHAYGAGVVRREMPLRAIRRGDIWFVEGTLRGGPHTKGGVAQITLCRSNGRVLQMDHEK